MPDLRRILSERTAAPRARRLVRGSGLFDRSWYEQGAGRSFPSEAEAIAHYVDEGAETGLSPHPLFDPAWYTTRVKGAARSTLGPLAHYLRRGAPRGDSTHPVIDSAHYLEQFPDATEHDGGVVGHFLEVGWRRDGELNDWFDATSYQRRHPEYDGSEPAIVHFLRTVRRRVAETPDHRDFPRAYTDFDNATSERFVAEVTSRFARARRGDEPPPLVSIITPTRDRSDVLPLPIQSVLDQTYERWELLVVDDGSADRSEEVVTAYDDPRIHYVKQPPSGVCRARNHGLELAQGRYVAYLDSDNAWQPRYLEVMVAFLETTDHDAAYSALQMEEEGEIRFRGVPFDRGALLEQNYIDCNTLVHDRQLASAIGGWDEELRRTNDWDYVIRLSAVANLDYAPFIGVRYDHDAERGDRITVREPVGYRLKVRAKHLLDWEAAASSDEDPGLVSIVIASTGGNLHRLNRCIAAIKEHTPQRHEIIVVDHDSDPEEAFSVLALEEEVDDVRVVRSATDLYDSIAPNLGAITAKGATVVFVGPTVRVLQGWLDPLLAPLQAGEAVATQPKIVGANAAILSAGYLVPEHGTPYEAFRDFAEHAPEARESQDRQAVDGSCMALWRRDLVAVEGFDPLYRAVMQDIDLCLRLREATGRPARYVAESMVVRGSGRTREGAGMGVDDQRVFEERWLGRVEPDETRVLDAAHLRPLFYELTAGGDTFGQAVHRPVVDWIRDRPRRHRWSIKVGPRSVDLRPAWGDWHFALALKEALEERGQQVTVDLRTAWYRPTSHLDDITLTLRGIIRYVPNPRHLNLMWLISHPDKVVRTELARFDHLFVASYSFAERLAARTEVPVEPLLQCTDAGRFAPGPRDPDGAPVLFVGNSREVLRPIVRDAVAAKLPLEVYGGGWEELIPERYVRDSYLPNEQLPVAYRSAGVVLNDHWEDMRREGFVSNRLFDLTACGARVISDHVEGIERIFDGAVRVYREPADLKRLVREIQERALEEDEQRQELAERVRREHSFGARADRLLEVAEAYLSAPQPASDQA
jgi:O-antigen biosynthesis protein